jgi:putative endonuclease
MDAWPMGNPRHLLGLAAEDAVARWLTDAGWTIVGRRVRTRAGGEVDIIALDRTRALVAIEVRARSTNRNGGPAETIDPTRVERLGRTLAAVAARERLGVQELRIDLVTATPAPGEIGRWRLRRIGGIGEA